MKVLLDTSRYFILLIISYFFFDSMRFKSNDKDSPASMNATLQESIDRQRSTLKSWLSASLIQIADGALSKISDLLTRAVTLAEQSASETVGASCW